MAVSPLGNVVYVNQNMQVASQNQSTQHARFDMQAFASMEEFDAKQKELKEVRPTEETHQIDPDAEHEKNQADQEEEEREKLAQEQRENEEEEEENGHPQLRPPHIDITV